MNDCIDFLTRVYQDYEESTGYAAEAAELEMPKGWTHVADQRGDDTRWGYYSLEIWRAPDGKLYAAETFIDVTENGECEFNKAYEVVPKTKIVYEKVKK